MLMSEPRKVRLSLALALLLSAGSAGATELSPELAEKKRWLEQVEAGDYLYWKRVIDRIEHPGEWNPPPSWYVPRVIIAGGEQPYFREPKGRSTIAPAALEKAWSYARERNTRALLVLHKGVSVAENYAAGYHRGSLMNARSLTKTLMGILYGIAIDEGAIRSVHDRIGDYISEWNDDPRGDITLRQYLHNVSGLELPSSLAPGTKASLLTNGTRVDETALSFVLADPAGTHFAQNNANTQVLGIALQRATGKPFDVYLSEKLWTPIGAGRAVMKQDRIGGSVVTYCCFEGSATDWIRLGHLMLTGESGTYGSPILPAGWVDEMLKASSVNSNYGLHIWRGEPFAAKRSYAPRLKQAVVNVQSEPFRASDLFFLDGGAKTRVWIVPSLELVIARFGDEPSPGLEFDEAFIPNTIIDGIRK